jgi:HUS1 checkpoint protein
MKFKASFTDDGISLLDKRKPHRKRTPKNSPPPSPLPQFVEHLTRVSAAGFLPALDKVGRVCHVYLTPTHAMLLHNLLGSTGPDGDGPQCVAQFAKDLLFRDYSVSSRDANRVAFSVDVALLQRALRSALAVHAQWPAAGDAPAAIQVKLVNKQTAGSRAAAPFLTFETKGARSAVVQDVPISKPLSRSDVARLQEALDAAQELPEVCGEFSHGILQFLISFAIRKTLLSFI